MCRRRKRGLLAALMLTLMVLLQTPFQALAATKPINNVSIRINANIEVNSRLPDIEIGSGSASSGKVKVSASGKYTVADAEWLDKSSKEVKAGDEPRMRVTLEPTDVSENYFLANYKASNVKVSGGTFVSAKRSGDDLVVTLRIKPVSGNYDPPVDAFWEDKNLGEARWEKPENTSGFYEIRLTRDGKSVYKVDKTSAIKYNFYPYMTEAGRYSFEVRTIPGTTEQGKYGKRSEWVESSELLITDRYVSDGKGQQKNTTKKGSQETVGWSQENGVWQYRFPNGQISRNKWENIEGLWYYFNEEGAMLTGWQNIGGEDYFLYDSGQMASGWLKIGKTWYYFRPEEKDGKPAGSVVKNGWHVIETYYYYFNADGSLYTGWLRQGDNWYYLNEIDNSLVGVMFTGWIDRNEKRYFADSNGALVYGWYEIDGVWYYFYPGTGEMARDTAINGVYVNADGIMV
ncbi:MAG: N-acetylmuramoyl-L-alanine amidase family protein [Lachnospiraceae bacterium]|nr:N-acetylmuramoyl-L-alanine amidase family protein [Lachnospiraceae bacterium]